MPVGSTHSILLYSVQPSIYKFSPFFLFPFGSALLNYAPAIAEAYYRNLPIIIISADRPSEWIDQDDSQTLRQYEALSNYVKKSYNIVILH